MFISAGYLRGKLIRNGHVSAGGICAAAAVEEAMRWPRNGRGGGEESRAYFA